jgi:Transposase DDE domain.
MDRTEWKFGKNWCNILAVTANCGSVGIPIWIDVLDKNRGISSTDERIKTLQKVIDLIGIKRICAFFADREFIGQDWIDYLLDKKIIFFIRLRNNFWFNFNGQNLQICKVAKEKLSSKKELLYDNVGIYQTYLSLAISRTEEGKDFIAIFTNSKAKNAIKNYRQRWTIEVLFQCLKSRGFDLQSTHLQLDKRITKLFMMCSLAFALCWSVGIYAHYRINPIPLKNHGYKAFSFFRKGMKFIREKLKLNLSMKKIFKELFEEALIRLQHFRVFSNFVG